MGRASSFARVLDADAPALTSRPGVGRLFVGQRKVRLGDARPSGELRLDALIRYSQDVSNDDTADARLPDDLAWVVRRTTVDVISAAMFGEELEIVTFCSGVGGRWAERRLEVSGSSGARYEVATLWIHLDTTTGRPRTLGRDFLDLYGEAAQGRKVTARLTQGGPAESAARRPWPLRLVDFDVFNHMNNAAYWVAVEERLPTWPASWSSGSRFTIEYRAGVRPGDQVEVAEEVSSDRVDLWWMVGGSQVAASVRVDRLAPQWYAKAR